jgi:hypothetical protein
MQIRNKINFKPFTFIANSTTFVITKKTGKTDSHAYSTLPLYIILIQNLKTNVTQKHQH